MSENDAILESPVLVPQSVPNAPQSCRAKGRRDQMEGNQVNSRNGHAKLGHKLIDLRPRL